MRRALLFAVLAVAALSAGAGIPACFKPDHPPCAFSCIDPPHTCPSGFMCGTDNLCHDPNSPGPCGIEPLDAAATADTAAADTAADRGP